MSAALLVEANILGVLSLFEIGEAAANHNQQQFGKKYLHGKLPASGARQRENGQKERK